MPIYKISLKTYSNAPKIQVDTEYAVKIGCDVVDLTINIRAIGQMREIGIIPGYKNK